MITVRDIISSPVVGPNEVSLLLGVSLPTARKVIDKIQKESKYEIIKNFSRKVIPTDLAIKELRINIDFLEKTGGLDKNLNKKGKN